MCAAGFDILRIVSQVYVHYVLNNLKTTVSLRLHLSTFGGCSKVLSFFPGLSQDLREAFASFRAWGFTTVGENGFSLGLEAFKDSCSCPGTSCVL